MKKLILLCTLILAVITVIPVSSQDIQTDTAQWESLFSDAFTSPETNGWPVANETIGTMTVTRAMSQGKYSWTVTSPDKQFSLLQFPLSYPPDKPRIRFSTSLELPDFSPFTCAGLLLDSQQRENSAEFYAYIICNDRTYSLMHYQNNSLETVLPFTALKNYDNDKAIQLGAELNDGWVDLYYNSEAIDTYNIGFSNGALGLIVMPQTAETTTVDFGPLTVEATDTESSSFDASELATDVPESVSRVVKMLNMKERISVSGGNYTALEGMELSLAEIGNYRKTALPISGQSMLLQAVIDWQSAYDRPNLPESGCGFYFREKDNYSYLRAYAAMDGAVYLDAFRNGTRIPLLSLNYDTWSTKGSGKLAVVVDTEKISILFDDVLLGTYTDATWIGSGAAGYLVMSGTNMDYGTKCIFSDVEAYVFEQ